MHLSSLQIYVMGLGQVSAFGTEPDLWERSSHALTTDSRSRLPVGRVPKATENHLLALLDESKLHRRMDRSALLGVLAARSAVKQAGWSGEMLARCSLNIGSARGPSSNWEAAYTDFLQGTRMPPHTSPTTTLAAAANAIAADLSLGGPVVGFSLTCTSSAFALVNAMVWLQGGHADRFLAGGTEAPLTPFVLAQMQALGLTRPTEDDLELENEWPCRPFAKNIHNTFVLGEGAAILALEAAANIPQNALAELEAFGWGTETGASPTAIDPDGQAIQQAIGNVLDKSTLQAHDIEAIIAHAPGTLQGDAAEKRALLYFWPKKLPPLTSVKAKVGHTLGASAALNLHAAVCLVSGSAFQAPEYEGAPEFKFVHRPKRVLVIATGFGGAACAFVVKGL